MKKGIVILVGFLCFTTCYAQQIKTAIDFETFGSHGVNKGLKDLNAEVTYKDVDGSPYLNNEFIKGNVYMLDGAQYHDIPLRYNIFSDQIEFMDSKQVPMGVSDPIKNSFFKFGDYTFTYQSYLIDNKEQAGYLEVLVSGTVVLYKKLNIGYQEAQAAEAYKEEKRPKFYSKSSEYLLSVNEGSITEIKNDKVVIANLTQIKSDVNDFIKREKLKLNKEEDLVRMVEFCNQ